MCKHIHFLYATRLILIILLKTVHSSLSLISGTYHHHTDQLVVTILIGVFRTPHTRISFSRILHLHRRSTALPSRKTPRRTAHPIIMYNPRRRRP